MSEYLSPLQDFNGSARLFPLPNLVLFPHVIQPLHIFEPRYRQLTEDALAGDRLLAIVLLQPGWEKDYEGKPPVHPVACLGKIVTEQRLNDGRFNLLLRGLRRVRIVGEQASDKLYRSANVELVDDQSLPELETARQLRKELADEAARWVGHEEKAALQFRQLLDSEMPLSGLVDIFCFALPLDVEFKQRMLEQLDVAAKARIFLEHIKTQTPPIPEKVFRPKYPPQFSAN